MYDTLEILIGLKFNTNDIYNLEIQEIKVM